MRMEEELKAKSAEAGDGEAALEPAASQCAAASDGGGNKEQEAAASPAAAAEADGLMALQEVARLMERLHIVMDALRA